MESLGQNTQRRGVNQFGRTTTLQVSKPIPYLCYTTNGRG